MKKIFAIIIILYGITKIQSFGQTMSPSGFGKPLDSTNFEVKLNSDFFLLGTLSDYNGRFYAIDRDKQIDTYYPYERSLMEYLTKFIYKNYQVNVDTVSLIGRKDIKMFSTIMAKRLHNYYDAAGNINYNIFDTAEKKYSFITGVFVRYGVPLQDNFYQIRIVNSEKDNVIFTSLKDLFCKKIVCKTINGLPSSDIFYFEATPRLIKYLNNIKGENKAILHALYKGHELSEYYKDEQNKIMESLTSTFK
ncbi:MAG: hypothetical protein ACO1OF_07355 [Adhaeribacter sp.]